MSAIGKNDLDPANPPTRSARVYLKQLTEKRMCWVDDPDPGWQSFRYCGVMSCSATRPTPTPSSTGSFTMPTALISPATAFDADAPDRPQRIDRRLATCEKMTASR